MKVFSIATAPLFAALVLLGGCDQLGSQLGIEDPAKIAAAKEAEGKAIGSACRHALRAIEDCYTLNPKAQKAAVFAGWREMDEYMRENKLEGIAPVVPRPGASKPAADADIETEAKGASRETDSSKSAASPQRSH